MLVLGFACLFSGELGYYITSQKTWLHVRISRCFITAEVMGLPVDQQAESFNLYVETLKRDRDLTHLGRM